TRTTAPVAAAARAGVAAGLDFFLLGGVVFPGRRQVLRLDFFLGTHGRGRGGARRRLGGRARGLVQRALEAGFGLGGRRRLGLLGHHGARGRRHHGADVRGLGFGLAAALLQFGGALLFGFALFGGLV